MEERERGYIFDPLRKKRVAATPEEQVRQKMIAYLNETCHWPMGLMNSEVEIMLRRDDLAKLGSKFRCDIVCYNRNGEAQVVVECKAPHIKITQQSFNQIWKYAIILKCSWIIVTNGESTYCCKWDSKGKKFKFVNQFPKYEENK